MKKYIYEFIGVVFAILVTFSMYQYKQASKYKNYYRVSSANEKAYNDQLDSNKQKSIVFQEVISNLKNSNDSLVGKLLVLQKDRKIKNSNVNAVAYQTSTATKTDTINTKDTIFVNNLKVDTTLVNEWYSLHLNLKYPSSIIVTPKFKSERLFIVSSKKECINTPSKLFFVRWFQKKHIVISVDVKENNPYINVDTQKFIKIIQ